jgi:hypothetical protein
LRSNGIDCCSWAPEVTYASLGISLHNSSFASIIREGSFIPNRRSINITTIHSDQNVLKFDILEGEHSLALYNKHIATVEMKDFVTRNGSKIYTVSFEAGVDSLLGVWVHEVERESERRRVFVGKANDRGLFALEFDGEDDGGGEVALGGEVQVESLRMGKEEKDGVMIVCGKENAWFDDVDRACRWW